MSNHRSDASSLTVTPAEHAVSIRQQPRLNLRNIICSRHVNDLLAFIYFVHSYSLFNACYFLHFYVVVFYASYQDLEKNADLMEISSFKGCIAVFEKQLGWLVFY